jgi:hypothetical protein
MKLEQIYKPLIREPQRKHGTTVNDVAGDTAIQTLAPTKVRYPWPLSVVPVAVDGAPDSELRGAGLALDVAPDGELELHWDNAPELPSSALIAYCLDAAGVNRAAAIDIRSIRPGEHGATRIIGRPGGFAEKILDPAELLPTVDVDTFSFRLGLSEEILEKWAVLGVLQRDFIDRVTVCPKCQSLPTFRTGCPNCGSARLANDRLIHHFACAHVGRIGDFESNGDLVCPKCRVPHLIVASDFDYVTGPYQCLDCRWSNIEPEQVAHCLGCQYRFPAYQAADQELRGFRAHRLDLLAVHAAR